MTWWTNIPNIASSFSSMALGAVSSALYRKRPSTQYLIRAAKSSDRLLSAMAERADDIVADIDALAQLRITASVFLIHEITACLQLLESHANYFWSESNDAQTTTSTVWLQVSRNYSFGTLARAEAHEQQLQCVQRVISALHQFIGMHMESVEDMCVAKKDKTDDLALMIVSACRQARAFMHAVSQSTCDTDLLRYVGEAVRTSIGVAPRQEPSVEVNVTGQLGTFWNQNIDTSTASSSRLSTHDARLTFQIIQRELLDLQSMGRHLRKSSQRGLNQPWAFQRRPLQYSGLVGLTASAARVALVHSRALGGSGVLEDKVSLYVEVCKNFVSQSMVEPLCRFYDQIFKASPTSASEESIAMTRSSLRELLIDFTEQNLSHIEGAEDLARNGSMQAVMDLIREQARHPFRNSIAGSLGQALFLQVQKLKCDVEELMLKTKQLLRAQELNLALVALVPSLLTATGLTYMLSTASLQWRSRNTDMIVSSAQTAKFLLSDVQRCLIIPEAGDVLDPRSVDFALRRVKLYGAIHTRTLELEQLVEKGLIRAPQMVLLRFLHDVRLLGSSRLTVEGRRMQIDRMFQCYPFLQGS